MSKSARDLYIERRKEELSEEILLLMVKKMKILGKLDEFQDAVTPIFKKISTEAEKTTNKHKNG